MKFPSDNYTPHGYLDIPTHTRNISPRGVLRSWGAGFRWHYPAYPGGYGGQREIYRAGFRLAMDGLLDLTHFDEAHSPYHSKNLISFELMHGDAHCHATYHPIGEHALRASIELRNVARLSLHVEYMRVLAANGGWGESGLIGRLGNGLILQGFEDGEVFVVWTSQPPSDLGISTDQNEAVGWASEQAPPRVGEQIVTLTGRAGSSVALYAVIGFQKPRFERLEVIMARGKTLTEAYRQLEHARSNAEIERAQRILEDDLFWSRAVLLTGDWLPYCRRGVIYDLETVRMMVKPPVGIYQHPWDAMQIQAPRVVLAETAIDALLLGYANPRLAQRLLQGVFLDAPEPNVPCSREDGSYNMVAADGTVCGTAPAWGYPYLVIDWLHAIRPERAWIERIYPRLADYLDWWLVHRRDRDGWLVYACSWESGQDNAVRFGPQPLGGGHPIRHIRPVELHAAVAHAAGVMEDLARILGRTQDLAKWNTLSADFSVRTDLLWYQTHYSDFDARLGRPTALEDIMQLAPIALGVALPERVAAVRPLIQNIHADSLTWPMLAWTAIEAALHAGLYDHAAELAASVCERVYRFWDARVAHPERTLPGISCEYWPLSGCCGGEGYGWGAFTTHLMLHTLLGITPSTDHLIVRPNLPRRWRVPGHHYGVSLHWRESSFKISLEALDEDLVRVGINNHRETVAWGTPLLYPWAGA